MQLSVGKGYYSELEISISTKFHAGRPDNFYTGKKLHYQLVYRLLNFPDCSHTFLMDDTPRQGEQHPPASVAEVGVKSCRVGINNTTKQVFLVAVISSARL